MPPRIPVRFPWTSNPSLAPVNSSLCVRAFTTTPSTLALGPESPNYIHFPKPLQPTFKLKPRVKGHLPVPRDVFKTRSPLPKASPAFIELSTPDPKKVKVPGPYSRDADYRLYKQRLAGSRKQAFREGVEELHARKTRNDAQHLARIQRIGAEKRALALAPPKPVDVLTATSVSKDIRDFLVDQLPSTSRANITEARRTAFRNRIAKHAAVRQARLHDLYTNAREFIVDEKQLDEAIEKAFGTEEKPMGWDTQGVMVQGEEGKSPWTGPMPEGVSDMLTRLKRGEGVVLAKQRVKRVAEELTGGKM